MLVNGTDGSSLRVPGRKPSAARWSSADHSPLLRAISVSFASMAPATAAEKATGSISAYGPARTTVTGTLLNAEDLRKTHAYWRACNYLKPALEKTPIADPADWQC